MTRAATRKGLRAVPVAATAQDATTTVLPDVQAVDTAIYDIQLALELLRQRCDVLRRTGDELKLWSRTGGLEGIHPVHAANRIVKIANEISSTTAKQEGK